MKEPYLGKLTNLDNVLLTPHIGSYSKEIRSKMEKEALSDILKSKV
jgi:D-3-phosphoglycerate dehydrogenase